MDIYSDNKFPARGCPTSHLLFQMLGGGWRNWEATRKVLRGGKEKEVKVNWEGLWHYKKAHQELPDDARADGACRAYALALGLSEDAARRYEAASLPQGYASLSLNAIRRITPFMLEGQPYHIAVLAAGIQRALGEKLWAEIGAELMNDLGVFEAEFDLSAARVRTHNLLLDDLISAGAYPAEDDIRKKFQFCTPKGKWLVWKKLGWVEESVKVINNRLKTNAETDTPRHQKAPNRMDFLHELISPVLAGAGFDENGIKKRLGCLYHHSVVDKWKEPRQIVAVIDGTARSIPQLNTPYTGAVQNPAAMRALHEVKKLVNHLLRQGILSEHAAVVVEMPRELNDMNQRAAIRQWQDQREAERAKIREFLAEQMQLQTPTAEQEERTRVWLEQLRLPTGEIMADFLDKQVWGKKTEGKTSTLVTKLHLWKEQQGICIYSGKPISISDVLFGDTQLEHTIPRSKSNDTRMENLTLATGPANRAKGNRIPAEITTETNDLKDIGFIRLLLRPWEKRISELDNLIDKASNRVRGAKASGDKEGYNTNVQRRWLLRFERSYWRDKVNRFYLEEVTDGFARRQLVDTQIITKYTLGWLKTVFPHVRGTKGELTAKLREWWGLQHISEAKDRTDHTHHLVDALVNAFVEPGLYNKVMAVFRQNEEHKQKGNEKAKLAAPWPTFAQDVKTICDETLVYHVHRDRARVQTKRKLKSLNGTQAAYTHGGGIWASLHQDTALAHVRGWVEGAGGRLQLGEGHVFAKRKDIFDQTKKMTTPSFPKLKEYAELRKHEITDKEGTGRILPVSRLRLATGGRIEVAKLQETDLPRLKDNEVNQWFLKEVGMKGLEAVKREGFYLPVKKWRSETGDKLPQKVRKVQAAFQHPGRPHKHTMHYVNDGNYALAVYKHTDVKKRNTARSESYPI